MLGALVAVRILMAQHSVWTALRTAGSAVHALDLAQARKLLKITACLLYTSRKKQAAGSSQRFIQRSVFPKLLLNPQKPVIFCHPL